MSEPVWVLTDVVLAEHGGLPGIRDQASLDSALARPRIHSGVRRSRCVTARKIPACHSGSIPSTYFDKLPTHEIGQRVRMGEVLGLNGNSRGWARQTRRERRPAIPFAVWYSDSERYAETGRKVIPEKGKWTDPNALYRISPPYDSYSLRGLPADRKRVSVPYILEDGTVVPADAKSVWPSRCKLG